jgi:hypothetical protein
MRLWNVLAVMLVTGNLVAIWAQRPPTELHLTIIEGEGAINNLRQRTSREPIVQVTDQNHRPVAGVYQLPTRKISLN